MVETRDHSRANKKNVLRLRTEAPLPDHKIAANLDDLDRAIIEAQQEDPFFSYADLAEAWSVTGATVRNRIKRLKTIGVIDVVMVINPYKVGYETFALIGIKIKVDANPEHLVQALQSIHGVSGVTMVAGNFDFFVTYVCHNLEEYRQFVTDELRKIPEIATFESYIGLDLYERKFLVGLVG